MKVKLMRVAVAAAVAFCCFVVAWSRQTHRSAVGTWRGESVCMDKSRTACRNEMVVYRFEEIAGKQNVLPLLADKIIDDQVPAAPDRKEYEGS